MGAYAGREIPYGHCPSPRGCSIPHVTCRPRAARRWHHPKLTRRTPAAARQWDPPAPGVPRTVARPPQTSQNRLTGDASTPTHRMLTHGLGAVWSSGESPAPFRMRVQNALCSSRPFGGSWGSDAAAGCSTVPCGHVRERKSGLAKTRPGESHLGRGVMCLPKDCRQGTSSVPRGFPQAV
jgi:hypothetical protein